MTGPLLTLSAIILYGALHSFLASRTAKGWVRRRFGPAGDRFYRLFFNLIGGLTFLPVMAVVAALPGPTLYRIPAPWLYLTGALQALSIALLAVGVLQTDAWHFLGLRQLISPLSGEPSQLQVRGLYRWVRHPLYSAGLLFIWLTPMMTASVLAFNLGLTAYIYIGSLFEERRLVAEFGQTYRDYRCRVPRLIPYLRPFPRIEA